MYTPFNSYSPLLDPKEKQQRRYKLWAFSVAALASLALLLVLGYFLVSSNQTIASSSSSDGEGTKLWAMKKYYKAGVIEMPVYAKYAGTYAPISNVRDARIIMRRNLARITPKVVEAAAAGVELLVLGEFVLTGLVSDRIEMSYYLEDVPQANLGVNSLPCNNALFDDRPILQALSCLALDNGIYMSVNWGDLEGDYQYNTQIVFAPNGAIVAKYWKMHTFKEDEYDTPALDDPTTFTFVTSGGDSIEVGILTCYDSMYASPLIPLVQAGVYNFIMSHWWVNKPTLMAPAWLQSLSESYGINLIAAAGTWYYKFSRPNWSSASGIYSYGYVLGDYFNYANNDIVQLTTALVPFTTPVSPLNPCVAALPPIPPSAIQVDRVYDNSTDSCYKSDVISNDRWGSVAVGGNTYTQTLSCGDFECTATVALSATQDGALYSEYFMMYVFNGYFGTPDGAGVYYKERFCSINVCHANAWGTDLCHYPTAVNFDNVEIEGTWSRADNFLFTLATDNHGGSYDKKVKKSTLDRTETKAFYTMADLEGDQLLSVTVIGRDYAADTLFLAKGDDTDTDTDT